jgi:hypothetical protein
MDLFQALPALRRHPLLSGKKVTLIGVSTIVLNGQPPPGPILRPILTARAFQLLVRAGHYRGS